MKKHYFIQWKSKVNGRAGKGSKFFDRDEARQLVDELNREYPQIHHEMVCEGSDSQEALSSPPVLLAIS
jgi:hypothetical protein